MLTIRIEESAENPTGWLEWHIGEPWPEGLGRVVTFRADGDELNLIEQAAAASQGKLPFITYTKQSGFGVTPNSRSEELALADVLPKTLTRNIRWLIEFRTSRPGPAYYVDGVLPTFDPRKAAFFAKRDDAQRFMLENGLGSPWHEVGYVIYD